MASYTVSPPLTVSDLASPLRYTHGHRSRPNCPPPNCYLNDATKIPSIHDSRIVRFDTRFDIR